MDYGVLISAIIQAGLGAAAWRLANEVKALSKQNKERLDNHDVRIEVLEKKVA